MNIFEAPAKYWDVLKVAFYTLFIYLELNPDPVKILFWIMLADTILGVVKVIVVKHEPFGFRRLLGGLVSKVAVLTIPLIVALMAKGIEMNLNGFVIVVMDVLIVSEGFSCVTNILSIKSRRNIQNDDYITLGIEKVRDAIRNILERLLGNLNP